jgi:hypothetical protein
VLKPEGLIRRVDVSRALENLETHFETHPLLNLLPKGQPESGSSEESDQHEPGNIESDQLPEQLLDRELGDGMFNEDEGAISMENSIFYYDGNNSDMRYRYETDDGLGLFEGNWEWEDSPPELPTYSSFMARTKQTARTSAGGLAQKAPAPTHSQPQPYRFRAFITELRAVRRYQKTTGSLLRLTCRAVDLGSCHA